MHAAAAPSVAGADPLAGACEHDAGTQTVTYRWPTVRMSELPVIQRSGDDILVGRTGVDCGDATIANTTLIRIVGSPPGSTDTIDIGISIANGGFHSDEGDGMTEEIPIRIETPGRDVKLRINTSAGDDHIVAGTLGTNLNAAEAADDVDVTVTGGHALTLAAVGCSTSLCGVEDPGTAGADRFSVAGGSGTGGPMATGFNRTGRLIGGQGEDHLTAGVLSTVYGGPGDDVLVGPGPVERTQVAFASYITAPTAVTVDLAAGTATGDGTDSLTGVGGVLGSRHADTLRGTAGGDALDGGFFDNDAGDVIDGRGGDDDLYGWGGNDEIDGGAGADTLSAWEGDDVLRGGEGNDSLFADSSSASEPDGDDRLEGGPGDDGMLPFGGDDLVIGGPGTDSVSFSFAEGGVTLDLAVTSPQNTGGAGIDTVSETENATGSSHSDTILGDEGPNRLLGGQGFGAAPPPNADVLSGRGDNDALSLQGDQGGGTADGGAGDDALFGDEGPDTLDGGPGEDLLLGREGNDKLRGPADRSRDRLECGPGTDEALYDDGLDVLLECELGGPGTPPDDTPPGDPPPPDPPAPRAPDFVPPPPPAVIPPVVTPPQPTPTVAQLVALPSSRRCASRRKFTVRVRSTIRGQVERVTIFVNGKRVKKVKGRRIGLPIDLRGLPKGKIKVRLRVELADGRIATDTRRYRTCAKKKRKGQFGRKRRG